MHRESVDPAQITPEYWGSDILSPDFVSKEVSPLSSTIAPKATIHYAVNILSDCLGQVLKGDYTEMRNPPASFGPDQSIMPNGTVVVLDREELSHAPHTPSPVSGGWYGQIEDGNFAANWTGSATSPEGSPASRGSEVYISQDGTICYRRSLSWGVLLPGQSSDSRAICTYSFAVTADDLATRRARSRLSSGGLPSRWIEQIPLALNETSQIQNDYPRPEHAGPAYESRLLMRTREVRTVYPAVGPKQEEPSWRDVMAAAISEAGERVSIGGILPAPSPIPGH